MKRIIIGMSGASGLPYGIRLVEVLAEMPDIETHLVMTNAAKLNIGIETDHTVAGIEAMADVTYNIRDIAAGISSGSFRTDGMIVAPCSMRTLSAITHSYAENLLVRAADVVLKERRRLVIMPRETPLHTGHCKLFYEASVLGAIIAPPTPAFYNRPQSIDDIVNASVGRVLDLFDIEPGIVKRWEGVKT
jgi:4-hydroxy-3-polyprenylbenzoate decarboxylase